MYMFRKRLVVSGIAVAGSLAVAAHAQSVGGSSGDMGVRECRLIADVAARLACYDDIPIDGSTPSAPPRDQIATQAPASSPRGFGAEMVPQARRPAQSVNSESEALETEAQVAAVRVEKPGIYVLTLVDGAQWRFVDAASLGYNAPDVGDTVSFRRGAMGSVRMSFDAQRGMRVQRIR